MGDTGHTVTHTDMAFTATDTSTRGKLRLNPRPRPMPMPIPTTSTTISTTTDSTTDTAMATHHTPMVPTDTHTPMDTDSPDTTATISTRGRLRLRPSLRLRLIPTTTTAESTALHTLMADTLMATHHMLVPTGTHTPMDTVDTDTTTRFLKSTLSDLIIPKK